MNLWTAIREMCLWFVVVVMLLLQIFTYRMNYISVYHQDAGLGILAYAITQASLTTQGSIDSLKQSIDELPTQADLQSIQSDIQQTQVQFRKVQAVIEDKTLGIQDTVTQTIKELPSTIDSRIQFQQSQATVKLQNLRDSTVMIQNTSLGSQGSGVIINFNEKIYVLTAGHMIENVDDEFVIVEKGQECDNLKVVNVNKKTDLLLLEYVDPDHIVSTVRPVDVAEDSPISSSPVNLVGSPLGIEDLASEGRIIGYSSNYVYFFDHVFFGSSGGGMYNSEGQLSGIISHMEPVQIQGQTFIFHAASNVARIHEFLATSSTPKTADELEKLLEVEMVYK